MTNEQLTDIFNRYNDMVYRIAYSHTANETAAADIFQDVFLKLVENGEKLKDDEHLKYWLIRVTINCCNRLFRDKKTSGETEYDDELEKDLPSVESGEDVLLRKEKIQSVQNALKKLKPPEYRDILYLFYFEDLPIRKMAEILNTTEGNVKTKLSRARSSLKKILLEAGQGA